MKFPFFPNGIGVLSVALTFTLVVTNCAPTDGISSPSLTGGRKNIEIQVNSDNDLDSGGAAPDLEFPARILSTGGSGNGIKTFTAQLEPYENSAALSPVPEYRVHPVPSIIKFRSQRLNGVPLEKVDFWIGVASSTKTATTLSLRPYDMTRLKLKSANSKRATITVRGKGGITFIIDNVDITDTMDIFSPSRENIDTHDSRNWDATSLSWTSKDPNNFYMGDGGAELYYNSDGWHLVVFPAGPDNADLSYLENRSKRGEFD